MMPVLLIDGSQFLRMVAKLTFQDCQSNWQGCGMPPLQDPTHFSYRFHATGMELAVFPLKDEG